MRTIVICALLVLVAATGVFAQDDSQILPADNGIAGWKKTGPSKRFVQADLYGYIDGGAELFLEYGFEQLTVQKYGSGADEFTVEAYRMSDSAAAMGVYLMKAGKETPATGFKDRNTANRYQLTFARNRYFVIVNNTSGKPALAPLEQQFASAVALKLPAPTTVPELQALPREGLVPGSVRLVRGAYGLESVFTLGDGDILQLNRTLTATTGDYKTPTAAYTLIIATYADAAQAKRAFDHLQKNLDKSLKVIDQKPDRFVFQDYSKKFGAAGVTGRRLEVRVKLAEKPLQK